MPKNNINTSKRTVKQVEGYIPGEIENKTDNSDQDKDNELLASIRKLKQPQPKNKRRRKNLTP